METSLSIWSVAMAEWQNATHSVSSCYFPTKPFFSGLDTLPRGCVCLHAFSQMRGALSGISPPPRVGVDPGWVGFFWGKYL